MLRRQGLMRIGLLVVLSVVLLGACGLVVPRLARRVPESAPPNPPATVELVAGEPDALRVPADVVATMGIKTEAVQAAPAPPPLKLDGSLLLDPNRLTHVHTRFAGEVVEMGTIEGTSDEPTATPQRVVRALRFGDKVRKGQLLAALWSKELGEKKSELVDALSRLTLDRETQTRLEQLYAKGAVPERSLREAEQKVESDQIAVERAQRTLLTWKLTENDLEQIRDEAVKIHERRGDRRSELNESWARVEIRASIDGVIVEKNIAVGDFVDTDLDIFKIADLSRLDVMAHIYEEDLPLVERRGVEDRQWRIYLKSDPTPRPLVGRFDQIGSIIDPSQHTALVMGWVDNTEGRLRMGQFVSALIDMPAPGNEVAIPATALVDRGGTDFVFVQPDAGETRYVRRQVAPIRRSADGLAYVRLDASPAAVPPGGCLRPGELVVTSGGLELAAALDELKSAADPQP